MGKRQHYTEGADTYSIFRVRHRACGTSRANREGQHLSEGGCCDGRRGNVLVYFNGLACRYMVWRSTVEDLLAVDTVGFHPGDFLFDNTSERHKMADVSWAGKLLDLPLASTVLLWFRGTIAV